MDVHAKIKEINQLLKLPILFLLGLFLLTGFIIGRYFYPSQNKNNVGKIEYQSKQTPLPTNVVTKETREVPPIEKIRKKINGKVYAFRNGPNIKNKGSYQATLEFVVDDGEGFKKYGQFPDDFTYFITSLVSENTLDFWFVDDSPKNDTLFTVEAILPQLSRNYESVNRYTMASSGGQTTSADIIYTHAAGAYGRTQIVNYLVDQDILLLETRGGDGCGGWGIFWKLDKNGQRTDVHKFGEGCAVNEKTPSFKGYSGQKLIFQTMVFDKSQPPPIPYRGGQIYSIDPLTLKQEFLSSLPQDLQKQE